MMQEFELLRNQEEREHYFREVNRYLGYGNKNPDPEVQKAIDKSTEELLQTIKPAYLWKKFPVQIAADHRVEIEGVFVRSKNLSKNLKGCSQVCLMAATIGIGADRLIARASVAQMSRAVILQAAGAAMIEALCDKVNQKIRAEYKRDGLYCRPRFSPGYGDLPLEFQRDFFRIMNLPKEIGVSLTDSLLMMPSKSVTALIGVSETDERCHIHGCEVCSMSSECTFRRA